MPALIVNRYNQTTPTSLQENGCAVSTPIYINPTLDQNKQLLNAFRTIKQKELFDKGFTDTTTNPVSGIRVQTSITPPLSQIEQDLGMNEEALRMMLFSKGGIPERVFLKLQRLTGVYLITRVQLETNFTQWLDSLYDNGAIGNPEANTTSTSPKGRKTSKN